MARFLKREREREREREERERERERVCVCVEPGSLGAERRVTLLSELWRPSESRYLSTPSTTAPPTNSARWCLMTSPTSYTDNAGGVAEWTIGGCLAVHWKSVRQRQSLWHRRVVVRMESMLRAPVRGYAWALLATVALALAVALGPGTGEAQAQQAVCSNNPGPGERIECTEPATSTADIDIDVEDVAITTMDRDSIGIYGEHSGTGDVTIDVQGGTITTESTDIDPNFGETSSHGIYGHHIYGEHPDAAAVDIDVEDVDITTKGVKSHGIYGSHQDTGDVTIDVEGGTIMTESTGLNTSGVTFANGIYAGHQGTGVVDINVRGGTMITTMGVDSHGIYGSHLHNGAMDIDVENVDIKTMGVQSFGIFGEHGGSTGDIDIFLQGGSITTQGLVSHGIYALHQGLGAGGDIVINTRNHVITTESTDVDPDYLDTFSHGIYARHQSIGNITIDARGGGITTKGVFSYGLYALHEEDGDITIDTRDGHTIMTTGGGGHGIVAEQHQGTMDSRSIAITVGGTVNASGAAAQGVRVGRLDNGALDRVAAIGEDGYRQQTVTVNGSVMGDDAGVWLAGGGRVVIGPEGTIGAQSGIAILATGTVPEVPAPDPNPDSVAAIPAILPKLRVDLNLGGRPVAQAIGNNWIMNDGGETTIAVNGTVLHEGATGVTGRTAANGVWNVRMREEGVNVDYITDPNPANWEMIEPTAGVVADRDFSAQDFNEARRPSPPPPPPPMPMPQTVMVDEPVFGDADEEAGVHLPAGGRVLIGPAGTVGGESGIAILAEGDAPMLHVDLTLDGRRVAEVIGTTGSSTTGAKPPSWSMTSPCTTGRRASLKTPWPRTAGTSGSLNGAGGRRASSGTPWPRTGPLTSRCGRKASP